MFADLVLGLAVKHQFADALNDVYPDAADVFATFTVYRIGRVGLGGARRCFRMVKPHLAERCVTEMAPYYSFTLAIWIV